jgi:hypothetical protein
MTTPRTTAPHAAPDHSKLPASREPTPARRAARRSATLGLWIGLACATNLASCTRAPDLTSVSSPAPARRRPPPEPEGCVEVPLPAEPPTCG